MQDSDTPSPASGIAFDPGDLRARLKTWARELGFADAAISRIDLAEDAAYLESWIAEGLHGEMEYMARDPEMRSDPARLRPGTVTVISARIEYWPQAIDANTILADGTRAYISRYALGRDYHKLIRSRLKKLAERLRVELAPHGYRVLADSAPSLEKALARNAGLGWIGKNTLVLNREVGSFFFLGEIYTDLPLPLEIQSPENIDAKPSCGRCTSCIDLCPTGAIIAPYRLDARRCISYLTIENRGSIPPELRPLIGNRIFGCDDCQLVCPWNRYAGTASDPAFAPRHGLDNSTLLELFDWSEEEWLRKTEGMGLRRATYPGWLRNLAVAMGNAPASAAIRAALVARMDHCDEMVREHVAWALQRQSLKSTA